MVFSCEISLTPDGPGALNSSPGGSLSTELFGRGRRNSVARLVRHGQMVLVSHFALCEAVLYR